MINHIFLRFYFQGRSVDLPRTIGMESMASMAHLRTSLVAERLHPGLLLTVATADAAREKIRSENSVEMMTKIGLEAVVAVGNLSNFDSLEFHEKEKKKLYY